MTRLIWSTWIVICLPVALAIFVTVSILDRYDRISGGGHARLIRRLVPWPVSRLAALIPIAVVLPSLFGATPSFYQEMLWLLVGVWGCEVYSVCLHRESFIAAYEPWRIPEDARPLGLRPRRVSDRRLHYLLRIQVIYLIPLVIASLSVTRASVIAWILCFACIVKYVTAEWVNYESYLHWDMHCDVLELDGAPRLSAFWRGVGEWILGPAVGSLPRLYSTEHLMIHHPANSGPKDLLSALPFNRRSLIEFSHYHLKTIGVLATALGVVQHRRLTPRMRASISVGALGTFLLGASLIALHRPLGYWLLLAVVYRGTHAAVAQYTWHGLHDGSGSHRPLSTTILWLPAILPNPEDGAVGRDAVHPYPTDLPPPGADWGFYDNYHLIHHLHTEAHFSEFPRLLSEDLPRIRDCGSPILSLAVFDNFFGDLMSHRYDRIARGLESPLPMGERVSLIRSRLEPWPDARSPVAVVSESRLGTALDATLSRVWCHISMITT